MRRVVNQFKGYVSGRAGRTVWQKGYYEHIISSRREYEEIWRYVDENPLRWAPDECFRG